MILVWVGTLAAVNIINIGTAECLECVNSIVLFLTPTPSSWLSVGDQLSHKKSTLSML